MNPVAVFASLAFETRNLSHKAHLKTRSFSQHSALDEFYHQVVELVDKFVETYQGEFGVIEDYPEGSVFNLPKEPVQLITVFRNWMDNNCQVIAPTEDLQNILQEIRSLSNQTLYKLQNLT